VYIHHISSIHASIDGHLSWEFSKERDALEAAMRNKNTSFPPSPKEFGNTILKI
jgi:hypothetical protein